MRRRDLTILAVTVVVLIVGATTAAVTHHGSFLGLGRESGTSTPLTAPAVTQPPPPPAAAVGSRTARATAPPRTRQTTGATRAAQSRSASAIGGSARGYPGTVSCPDRGVPSPDPYAWQCTHADGTPVRWSTDTITVWVDGLTAEQGDALHTAETQWTPHSGISLVAAPSAATAQVVITEVDTLDALPELGSDVVEYAVTEVHQTSGYYDHATMQVANAPFLSADTWLDTLLHELGHVAGLAHVADSDQIMRRVVGLPQTSYGDGDIAGLESERPR